MISGSCRSELADAAVAAEAMMPICSVAVSMMMMMMNDAGRCWLFYLRALNRDD